VTDTAAIECDEFFPHPPAAVWRALTEPALLARWFARGDIEPVVGHRFTLELDDGRREPCEVVAVEAERLLVYRFAAETLHTTITWRLVPEGNGTRLFLHHEGFDPDSALGKEAFDRMGYGWPIVVRRVGAVVADLTA